MCVVFLKNCLSVFFLPLYCLSFDLRLLITLVLSSNLSYDLRLLITLVLSSNLSYDFHAVETIAVIKLAVHVISLSCFKILKGSEVN